MALPVRSLAAPGRASDAADVRDAEDDSGATTYLFILNKVSGAPRAYYLGLHPVKGHLLPHLQHVTWPKIKGWLHFRTVVVKNCLYVLGGIDRETGRHRSQMMRYDPLDDKWTECSSMKKARAHFTADEINKKIFVTGGETSPGEITDVCESYEPMIDAWTVETKLPAPRMNHSSVVMNRRLYIFGGQSKQVAFNSNLWEASIEYKVLGKKEASVYEWSLEWTRAMTRQIQKSTLFTLDGVVYSVGGIVQGPSKDGSVLDDERDVDRAESDKDEEAEAAEKAAAGDSRFNAKGDYVREIRKTPDVKVIRRTTRAMQGVHIRTGQARTKQVGPPEAFRGPRLVHARCGAAVKLIGNRLYAFGGYRVEDEADHVLRVEYYHIRKKKWYPAFNLCTEDSESFREVEVCLLKIPKANANFKSYASTYKFPLW